MFRGVHLFRTPVGLTMFGARCPWGMRAVHARPSSQGRLRALQLTPPRSLATRLLRLFAIAALVLTGTAAQAQAAFTAGMTTATPANTSSMQYSDFNLVMDFPDDSTPKSLQLDLPVGQLGAVDSATVCSDTDWQNDNCATSAQIVRSRRP